MQTSKENNIKNHIDIQTQNHSDNKIIITVKSHVKTYVILLLKLLIIFCALN